LLRKALQKREQDPNYGFLTINTLDIKPDSKLKLRRMKQVSLFNLPSAPANSKKTDSTPAATDKEKENKSANAHD